MAWDNGLYRVVGQDPDSGMFYSLMLRVDLEDGSDPGAAKRLSLDAFKGRLPPSVDPDELASSGDLIFLGTYRSGPIDKPASQDELSVTLFEMKAGSLSTAPTWSMPPSVSVNLLKPAAPEDRQRQLLLSGLSADGRSGPTGALKMDADYLGSALRALTMKVDRAPGYPDPFRVTAPMPGGGTTTLMGALLAAGFNVQVVEGSSQMDQRSEWSVPQLRSVVATRPTSTSQAGDSLV